jgi:hypothetical protein
MFDLTLAFEAGVELLMATEGTVAVMLEQVTTALGQDDGKFSPPVQPNRVDQTLLAQVAQVAAAWIRRPVGVVP